MGQFPKEQCVFSNRCMFYPDWKYNCSTKRFSASLTSLESIQFHIVTIRIRYCVKEIPINAA